jgi:hypothetical protein
VTYDPQLAARVREMFADDPAVREQTMFGARAFLVADRLAVAASADGGLMVRIDPAHAEQLLRIAVAQPIQMSGRTMRGWVHIDSEHVRSRRRLDEWIAVGTAAETRTLGATP